MEPIQSRRRINQGNVQENAVAKSIVPKPASRPALGDLGNRNVRTKVNTLLKSTMQPPNPKEQPVKSIVPPLRTKVQSAKPSVQPAKPTVQPAKSTVLPGKSTLITRTAFGVVNRQKPTLLKQQPAATDKPIIVPKPTQVRKAESGGPAKEGNFRTVQNVKKRDLPAPVVVRKTSEKCFKDIIDSEEDPLLVSEYINDIMAYHLAMEEKYPISQTFLNNHSVTPKYRSVLVNWLAEVVDSFRLVRETFQLTIALVDRYLEINHSVTKVNLQLVGVAALFIAYKYEETVCLDIEDLVYICDNAYSKLEIFKMERDILGKLSFTLGRPTPIQFLRRYNKVFEATSRQHEFGKLFIDLGQMDAKFSSVPPSMQAAAACCLAIWLTDTDSNNLADGWCQLLEHYSRYSFEQIEEMVRRYAAMVVRSKTSELQTIYKIYADTKELSISNDGLLCSERLKAMAATAAAW